MNMKIWKLTPIQKSASIEPTVIVRASSEEEARRLAEASFGVPQKVKLGDDTPHSPWSDPAIVACVSIQDPKYSADGPAAILHSKNA